MWRGQPRRQTDVSRTRFCTVPGNTVKLSLCLIPHHEDVLGSGGVALYILNLGTNGGERPASRPSRFTPGKDPPVLIGQKAGWLPFVITVISLFSHYKNVNESWIQTTELRSETKCEQIFTQSIVVCVRVGCIPFYVSTERLRPFYKQTSFRS
jgi:hypothetical protein